MLDIKRKKTLENIDFTLVHKLMLLKCRRQISGNAILMDYWKQKRYYEKNFSIRLLIILDDLRQQMSLKLTLRHNMDGQYVDLIKMANPSGADICLMRHDK